ncbi:AP2 domain transcription factor AP2VI-1 [Toxoplasma gondii TgCatPRC2]|uniref:AP2 domain transcription factor AP2VI-1 n=1 Tax=Toxoplasma gondii TgCatPRC2 TaxID=1130821 RepID=A0A151H9R1_TOXGO|nr:AP2 domain transcription factor AP2VI-1 [Toxoplasma gondii TgCatPRC2]
MDVSRERNTPNSVVPTHLPHLDICWGATANVSGWPAADVLPDPAQLPIFCRNVDAESTDVDNSSTSGKGCTTRTCCTEDEFPLEAHNGSTNHRPIGGVCRSVFNMRFRQKSVLQIAEVWKWNEPWV